MVVGSRCTVQERERRREQSPPTAWFSIVANSHPGGWLGSGRQRGQNRRLAQIERLPRSICPGPNDAAVRADGCCRSFAYPVPGPTPRCCRPKAKRGQVPPRQGSIRTPRAHTAVLGWNGNTEPALRGHLVDKTPQHLPLLGIKLIRNRKDDVPGKGTGLKLQFDACGGSPGRLQIGRLRL